MGRTIIVGDIHGCYDELLNLLEKIDVRSDDRVIGVGDLSVKGPQSLKVIELFRMSPNFSSVIGNQDLAVVDHWKDPTRPLKKTQEQTFTELSPHPEALSYLADLPYWIDLSSHFVVHAGVRPGIPLTKQDPADLTELRTLGEDRTSRTGVPWYESYDGEKTVLFGHWPAPEPRRGKKAIGLDTGCVYGYELTAYILETAEFVKVPALEQHAPSRM